VCALVGESCSLSVVMRPAMPREGMILTGITVHRCVWSFSKCRINLSLRSFGNELVFFGQMHQKGRIKPIDLSQIFLGIAAVISNRSVNAVATHGCQEDHQRAKAIAEDGDLAVALREFTDRLDGVLDVPCARVSVISSVQTKAVLPVSLGDNIKVDARLLTPEQVWRDCDEALFGQFIAGLANVGVHPEQLLQNDHGGSRRGLRSCDIGGERAVMSFYGDVIFHCVLLRRPGSSSADVIRIGGGILS